jgi:hypothetical protein
MEEPGVDGRIILKLIFRIWDRGCMDRIGVAVNRNSWPAVVNVVMKLCVPKKKMNFLSS